MLLAAARSSLAPGLSRRAASTIATKYSKAVFGAALAKSPATLNKVATELASVANVIKTQPEVGAFITNPTLSQQDREKALVQLFNKVDAKTGPSEITKNLLALLSENGRLQETEGVIEGFNELFAEHKGELTVTVTSATPLPKDILTRLETTLKQSQTAQKAKVLKISNKVNPTVLGGLIVDFGDKTVDLSALSRVTKLNNVLTQSV
jgi:F-type H+-transporting ATPase subunit O